MEEKLEELRIERHGLIARGPLGMEIAREVERRRAWMRLALAGLAAGVFLTMVSLDVDAVVVATLAAALARVANAW